MLSILSLLILSIVDRGICAGTESSSSIAKTELDFDPIKYEIPFPPVLEQNTKLVNAVKLLNGQLVAPESLLLENGGQTIYTGSSNGTVLKIVNQQIAKQVKLNTQINANQTCGTFETLPICGWPHCIRRLDANHLVVIDSYRGLFKFTNDLEQITQLLPGDHVFMTQNGIVQCALWNSMDLIKNNSALLISCSSIKWDNNRAIHDFLEGRPNGMLVEYNISSGKAKIVQRNLNFANGVQAHPDNQSVVVSELTRARIMRYFYAGPKAGSIEVFADNLPGFPDNIKLSADRQTLFVGMDQGRHSTLMTTTEKLGPYKQIRFDTVMLYPQANLRTYFVNNLLKRYGVAVELDLIGNILDTWQDPSGSVIGGMSEAADNGTHLFIGSSGASFIGIVLKDQ